MRSAGRTQAWFVNPNKNMAIVLFNYQKSHLFFITLCHCNIILEYN